MSGQPNQDQGVQKEPIRSLDDIEEDESKDDLAAAAEALGVDRARLTEPDGQPTELG